MIAIEKFYSIKHCDLIRIAKDEYKADIEEHKIIKDDCGFLLLYPNALQAVRHIHTVACKIYNIPEIMRLFTRSYMLYEKGLIVIKDEFKDLNEVSGNIITLECKNDNNHVEIADMMSGNILFDSNNTKESECF